MVSWERFLELPSPEPPERYELHDGEVVVVPLRRPCDVWMQVHVQGLLRKLVPADAVVMTNWPYRPAPNLQYWVAGVAYLPRTDFDAMPRDEWPVYSPPLIFEVVSPTNTRQKTNQQRMIALSAGTEEFWVVDEAARTIEVSRPNGIHVYRSGDTVPIHVLNASLAVDEILA